MTKRRDLFLTALALAGVAGGWQAWIRKPQPLDFTAMPALPGWRRLNTGELSAPIGASFLTLGLSDESVLPLATTDLDTALYRQKGTPPVAVFSDFFCPFCRRLTAILARRPDLLVNWHELPLLGPNSEVAARAAIAADLQNGYAAFISALERTGFRPSPEHMQRVAGLADLDPRRLQQDMDGPLVAERLEISRRAAATLGIYGTPGMTIGQTLVMGEITAVDLDRILEMET